MAGLESIQLEGVMQTAQCGHSQLRQYLCMNNKSRKKELASVAEKKSDGKYEYGRECVSTRAEAKRYHASAGVSGFACEVSAASLRGIYIYIYIYGVKEFEPVCAPWQ